MAKILYENSYYRNMTQTRSSFNVASNLSAPSRLYGSDHNSFAYAGASSLERYIQLDFKEVPTSCYFIRIWQNSDTYSFDNFTLYGSDDGEEWTQLLDKKNITGWVKLKWLDFPLDKPAIFSKYRLDLVKTYNGSQSLIWGFEVFGKAEGDDYLKIEFKNEENIPASYTGDNADGKRRIIFTDSGKIKVTDLRGRIRDFIVPPLDITSLSDISISADSTYSSQKIESMFNSVETGQYLSDISGIEDTPIGNVIEVVGENAPLHYLPCNGQIVSKSRYPYLYNYFVSQFGLANKFGGNGITNFCLPSLNDDLIEESKDYTHPMESESDDTLVLGCSSRSGYLYDIVNDNENTVSTSPTDSSPWFSFSFNRMVNINQYSITVGEDNFPTTWIFQGKKGTTWINIETRTNETFTANEKKNYSFPNSNTYSEYRIIFSDIATGGFITLKKIDLTKIFVGSSNKVKCIKYEPTFYMNMNPSEKKSSVIDTKNIELSSGLSIPLNKNIDGQKFLLFKITTQESEPKTIYIRDELFNPIIVDSTTCSCPYTIVGKVKNEIIFTCQYWFTDSQTMYIGDISISGASVQKIILSELEGIKESYTMAEEKNGFERDVLFSGNLTANSSISYPYADNKKISDYSFLILNAAIYVDAAGYGNTASSIIYVPTLLENESTYCMIGGGVGTNQYNVGVILNEDNFCVSSSYTSLPAWNKQVLRSIIGIK